MKNCQFCSETPEYDDELFSICEDCISEILPNHDEGIRTAVQIGHE